MRIRDLAVIHAKDRQNAVPLKSMPIWDGRVGIARLFYRPPLSLRLQYPCPHLNVDNRRYREFPNCTGGNMSITSFNGGPLPSARPDSIRPKITTTTIHDKKLRHE